MDHSNANTTPDIHEPAARTDPADAQLAVAKITANLGAYQEWSGADQLEYIAMVLPVIPDTPEFTDQDDAAVDFWSAVNDH